MEKLPMIFMGVTKLSEKAIDGLVDSKANVKAIITLPQVGSALSDKNRRGDLKSISERNNIPLFTVKTNNEILNIISDIKPKVLFAVGWPKIITNKVLSYPELGCIGFHPTPLPKRRGGAPLNWLIHDGQSEGQLTLFKMIDGIDNGPILHKKKFDITNDEYISDVLEKLNRMIGSFVREAYEKLQNDPTCFQPQNHTLATYTWRRTPEDGYINWYNSSLQIFNLIRAVSHPFSGAFSFINKEKKLFLWRANLVTGLRLDKKHKPGTLIGVDNDGIIISTKDYCLKVSNFEINNKIYQDSYDYKMFYDIYKGTVFN